MNKDMEDRIIKLLEIFPQKCKKDLLEVKESLFGLTLVLKQVNLTLLAL